MGDDSESFRKEGSNSAGLGSNLQGGGAVSVIIWKRELGGERVDAKVTDSVPPLSSATDHRDDRETWGRIRMGVSSGRGGNGLRGDPPHRGIHQEAEGDHI